MIVTSRKRERMYHTTYFLIIPSFTVAYLVAVIWKPEGQLISFFEKLKEYVQIKNKYSWVIRFAMAV
ncbi:hypothetical protein KHA80_00925 [Anaerobacillus sp. HL2]|nr:hypothetical protein KHA80_00925 [Anaerobacillus sp. HL2]